MMGGHRSICCGKVRGFVDIYSVCNQKGGVGKTFTALNLAVGLAKQGNRVLAVDLDPQGSLSISLGVPDPDSLDLTIATKLAFLADDSGEEGEDGGIPSGFDPKEGILTHSEGIDFLPANIELADMEITLVTTFAREHLLGKYLDGLAQDYDVVVIDCSPSLGLVTINALACSHQVIIPVQAQYLSIKGMEQLFRSINRVKRKLNRSLDVAGILITMANTRTKDYKETVATLYETHGERVRIFESVVPLSTRAIEAPKRGMSIFAHDPKGRVAQAFGQFIQELGGNS